MDNRAWGLLVALGTLMLITFLSKQTEGERPSVATIYLSCSQAAVEAHRHLVKKLKEYGFKTVKEFDISTRGDMTIIHAHCEAALQRNTDVIIAVGATCAQMLSQIAKRRSIETPMVLLGCNNPVELGIVPSITKPEIPITGAFTSGLNDTDLAALIHAAAPNAKQVLIPYFSATDAAPRAEKRAQKAKEQLAEFGVTTKIFPIDNLANTYAMLQGAAYNCDVIACLEADGVGETQLPAMIKIAEKNDALVIGGSLESTRLAGIGYGTSVEYCAETAARIARDIVLTGKDPRTMPFEVLANTRECHIAPRNITSCSWIAPADQLKQAIDQSDRLAFKKVLIKE
jgi:ABC-type uncharacterized transport system substrate-binding protein